MNFISMPNMNDIFFKLMLKEQWLIECPELHARVSAIQDPVWQVSFVRQSEANQLQLMTARCF